MNTNKLQSFAAEARTSLMKAVRARIDAALEPNSLAQSDSPRAYRELTEEILRNGGGEQGRAKTAERHAYRWFNRIIALRYMDANEFTGVHVVSGEELDNPNALPAVLSAAKRGEFDRSLPIHWAPRKSDSRLPTIVARNLCMAKHIASQPKERMAIGLLCPPIARSRTSVMF